MPQGRAVPGLRAARAGVGPRGCGWAGCGTRPACCQRQGVCRGPGASGVEGLHRGCGVRRGCVGPPLRRVCGLATPPRAALGAALAVFSAPVSGARWWGQQT